jgi:hypothetical protein
VLSPADLRRLERVLQPLVDAVQGLLAVNLEPDPVAPVLDATADVMLVRYLGLEHMGRWVYLPGRPAKQGPKVAQEPSVVAIAGRLVGIRGGKPGQQDQPGTRVLVLAQGSALAELSVSVADRVDVAPREW